MNLSALATNGTLAVIVLMSALWLVARLQKKADIVDLGWALALGLLGVFYALAGSGEISRRVTLGAIVGLWSLRLSLHLLFDRVLKAREDGRYETLRAQWGKSAWQKLFIFFHAQGFLAVVLAMPFLLIASPPLRPFSGWDIAAVMLFGVCIVGESIADRQLKIFRGSPGNRGKTCRVGLWRYSRHPNYFFEWLYWWVFVLLSFGAPAWWLTPIVPLTMLYLIVKVTGIPATEAQALRSRGDDYREYQRTTSALIPWFPKR